MNYIRLKFNCATTRKLLGCPVFERYFKGESIGIFQLYIVSESNVEIWNPTVSRLKTAQYRPIFPIVNAFIKKSTKLNQFKLPPQLIYTIS